MHQKSRTFFQYLAILLFSAILIEVLIKGSGHAYNYFQQNQKKIVRPANPDTKVILCIGESKTGGTAENSYPLKLQKKLDQYYGPNKYFVINEGRSETNSEEILGDIATKIQEFRPDFVVTMMGINDFWALKTPHRFQDNFQPTKLYRLIKKGIRLALGGFNQKRAWENIPEMTQERLEPIPRPVLPDEPRSAEFTQLLKLGTKEFINKNFKELEIILTKLSKLGPSNSEAYFLKGIVELEKGDIPKSIENFQRYVDIHKSYQAANRVGVTYFIKNHGTDNATRSAAKQFLIMALTYRPTGWIANKYMGFISEIEKDSESAFRYFLTAYESGLREFDLLISLSRIYRDKGDLKKEEEILASGLYEKGQVVWLWTSLMRFYIYHERLDEAEEFLAEAEKKYPGHPRIAEIKVEFLKSQGKSADHIEAYNLMNFYDFPIAKENYLKMAEVLKQNKIKHIVMQYPLRPVSPLKALLADYKEVVFVDNETVFRDALAKYQYEEIFLDRSAGDFGHATPHGNEIMSKNLIKTLEAENLLPSL